MLLGESVDLVAGAKDEEGLRGCVSCRGREQLVDKVLVFIEGQLYSRVLELSS